MKKVDDVVFYSHNLLAAGPPLPRYVRLALKRQLAAKQLTH